MSAERPTRVSSGLPEGNWFVAMRLTGLGDISLGPLHRDTLRDLTPGQYATSKLVEVHDTEGDLYMGFSADGVSGDEAIRDCSALLWLGLDRTGLLIEVEAKIDA